MTEIVEMGPPATAKGTNPIPIHLLRECLRPAIDLPSVKWLRIAPMSGAKAEAVVFMETLPASCPPNGAGPFAYEAAYRFVNNQPATDEDFASHQALEKKTGKGRPRSILPCVWAATSLFVSRDSAFDTLPKLRGRFKFVACVKITTKCGVSILKRSHISFWRYSTFKPSIHGYETL